MTPPGFVAVGVAGVGRAFGCLLLGLSVAMAAHEAGVPWWRDGSQIGDAFDIGSCFGMGVWWIARSFHPHPGAPHDKPE